MDTSLIVDVTAADFQSAVIERSRTLPVLVDFWAGWCGPCRMLTPQLEQVVNERGGAVELAKIDVDAEQELAQRYSISGIPHVKLFAGGREVAHFVGVRSAAAIGAFLDQHAGPSEFEQLTQRYRADGTYPEAIEAFDLGYVDQAFDHLLSEVRRHPAGDELRERARVYLVAAFGHFGDEVASVVRYRRQLASVLN